MYRVVNERHVECEDIVAILALLEQFLAEGQSEGGHSYGDETHAVGILAQLEVLEHLGIEPERARLAGAVDVAHPESVGHSADASVDALDALSVLHFRLDIEVGRHGPRYLGHAVSHLAFAYRLAAGLDKLIIGDDDGGVARDHLVGHLDGVEGYAYARVVGRVHIFNALVPRGAHIAVGPDGHLVVVGDVVEAQLGAVVLAQLVEYHQVVYPRL